MADGIVRLEPCYFTVVWGPYTPLTIGVHVHVVATDCGYRNCHPAPVLATEMERFTRLFQR